MDDPFKVNILGTENLVNSGINKTGSGDSDTEGISSELIDVLDLPMSDQELKDLAKDWEGKHNGYYPKIKPRQEKNKLYIVGRQRTSGDNENVISSNLIFEAQETFIPQALSKNPEPVVFSDNTEEGKAASTELKTMLQYHADVLCLKRKLGVMVRHWSVYFIGIMKHGWDSEVNDIKSDLRKPQNFVFDPDGYVDEFGSFVGAFLGERIESTAEKLIELFPKKKAYIYLKVDGKLGTMVTRTEWWTNKYCFTTFMDEVLDKHKNPYFNYETPEQVDKETGMVTQSATPGINHFGIPKMPYTFLSVFSLQERPHDITNLTEQSIPNQDRINERDDQISKNLRQGNNSIAVSGDFFEEDTAAQAARALEDGDPVLVPSGDVEKAIKRIPASALPAGVLESQGIDKETLRGIYGTQGLVPNNQPDVAVRNNIMAEQSDSSRIGGGIGDALEQVADNVFNWWAQLYCVFYDQEHYGAVLGSGHAVEYVTLLNSDMQRKFVISVSANSMKPKDEISEQNEAIDLANKGWLDPISLFEKLNYPDPMKTAKQVTLFRVNPQAYMMMYFPEQAGAAMGGNNLQDNPVDLNNPGAPVDESLAAPPANPGLDQVPINNIQ